MRSIVDTARQGAFNVLGSIDDPVVVAGRVLLGPPARAVDGATSLSTYAPDGAGSDARRTSHGHSEYLKSGSDSATNLVAVVADRPDATIPESTAERARKVLRQPCLRDQDGGGGPCPAPAGPPGACGSVRDLIPCFTDETQMQERNAWPLTRCGVHPP